MAFSSNQRVPNVSRYLANLNQVSPVADMSGIDDFSTDPSLDNLANLDFFDFESFNPDVNLDQIGAQPLPQHRKPSGNAGPHSPTNFPPFAVFHSIGQTQPRTHLGSAFPPTPQQYTAAKPQQPQQPVTGEKRKALAAQTPSPHEFEETSRIVAEEDKRRRNTAASARFRVKKKQREAALEKQAKDMSDRVQALEDKVKSLTMENKWLRDLITDKKDLTSFETYKLEHREEKELDSSREERDDGVGTVDADADADSDVDGDDA